MEIQAWIIAIATTVLALCAIFGLRQLRLSKLQLKAAFEERFNREYRELLKELPLWALLAEKHDDLKLVEKSAFFRYFDLSNAQIYYRLKNKISDTTWEEWSSGIEHNMRLPGFEKAFQILRERADGKQPLFSELALFNLLVVQGGSSPGNNKKLRSLQRRGKRA